MGVRGDIGGRDKALERFCLLSFLFPFLTWLPLATSGRVISLSFSFSLRKPLAVEAGLRLQKEEKVYLVLISLSSLSQFLVGGRYMLASLVGTRFHPSARPHRPLCALQHDSGSLGLPQPCSSLAAGGLAAYCSNLLENGKCLQSNVWN